VDLLLSLECSERQEDCQAGSVSTAKAMHAARRHGSSLGVELMLQLSGYCRSSGNRDRLANNGETPPAKSFEQKPGRESEQAYLSKWVRMETKQWQSTTTIKSRRATR
jgi:hypothetical protein